MHCLHWPEQGSPLGRDFGLAVATAGVTMLGLVPSIVKAWRQSACMAGINWASIKCFSSTGEASAPEEYHWLMSRVAGYRPVIEYCGGTELGGGYMSCSLLQPQCPSTFSMPTFGSRVALQTPEGAAVELNPSSVSDTGAGGTGAAAAGSITGGGGRLQQDVIGEVVLVPPMLGSSQRLLNADHSAVYYNGMPRHAATGRLLRRHGDEVVMLAAAGGLTRFMALGRCDDTMNLGGIKVSSVELERVVERHVAGVAEVAAVGVPRPGGGPEMLHLFIVPSKNVPPSPSAGATPAAPTPASSTSTSPRQGSSNSTTSSSAIGKDGGGAAAATVALRRACQAAISSHANPLFKVEAVVVRDSLPRTASNKLMRRVLRNAVAVRPKL